MSILTSISAVVDRAPEGRQNALRALGLGVNGNGQVLGCVR